MDRAEFMRQLEKMLSDIPLSEREEALDYYESYFEDAGEEREAEVIRELGSPGKVAAIIKDDLRESGLSYGQYTERGYEDIRDKEDMDLPERFAGSKEESQGTSSYEYGEGSSGEEERGREREKRRAFRAEQGGYHAKSRRSSGGVILILILLVFCAPFIKGAVGGVLGTIVGIALLPFLLVLALGAAALGVGVGAFACLSSGIALCAASFSAGILTMGIGFLLLCISLLLLLLLAWASGRLIPAMLRRFTDFCSNILNKGKKEAKGL